MREDTVFGAILIVLGVVIILVRSLYSRLTIRFQNRAWGLNYGEREVRTGKIHLVLLGLTFILVGIMLVLGILQSK